MKPLADGAIAQRQINNPQTDAPIKPGWIYGAQSCCGVTLTTACSVFVDRSETALGFDLGRVKQGDPVIHLCFQLVAGAYMTFG